MVIGALQRMPDRAGALGTNRFDRFGDTTLRTYGLYRVRRGALGYAGAVQAPGRHTSRAMVLAPLAILEGRLDRSYVRRTVDRRRG